VFIQVAEARRSREQFTEALLRQALQRDLVLIAAALGLLALGVTWALAPLARLRAEVESRPADDMTPIAAAGVPVKAVNKVKDGRPHIVDMLKAGEIQLVFTTVDETRTAIADSRHIRQAALASRITYYTSMAGCEAAVQGMQHQDDLTVLSLQDLHSQLH
jgi:hypothetical protein